MNVISVKCASPDAHLHLAPYEDGIGVEVHTLCLERWRKQEPAREGSIFCTECVAKWIEKQAEEERSK